MTLAIATAIVALAVGFVLGAWAVTSLRQDME